MHKTLHTRTVLGIVQSNLDTFKIETEFQSMVKMINNGQDDK